MPLAEVIERVLKSDPDLRISRIAREQAGYQITAAEGAYDPVLGLGAYRTKAVSPVASILGGTATGKLTQTEFNVTPQVTGLTPWGGSYNFKFSNSRQQNDSLFNTLNPQYPATAALNFTQPLWRGLRFDVNRHRIEVARAGQQLSVEQLRQRVIEQVTMAINAYWELDFAWNLYQVQTEAVRLAEQQFQSNRRQVEQGVLAPIDVTAAQTQVANFQQNLFLAQQALTAAENNLKTSDAAEPRGHAVGRRNYSRDPARHFAEGDSAAGRREPGALVAAGARTKCDRARRQQARRPAESGSGEAADQCVREPLRDGSGRADAAGRDRIHSPSRCRSRRRRRACSSGTTGNRSATCSAAISRRPRLGCRSRSRCGIGRPRRRSRISEAEGRKLKAVRDQIGMAIEADVRNAVQAETSAASRLEAATLARRSAEDQYSSEQRQFQAGTSTVFLVLQRQTDLVVARSREARAKADMAEARANLDRATGTTIQAQGINVTF